MTKYKQQVQDMLQANHNVFSSFKDLHEKYSIDPKTWQEKFNEEGQQVILIIQRWENNLCAKSESGKYGKYSSKLADKFWEEIRIIFPKINYVGLQTK